MAQLINAFPQIKGGTTYDDTERVVGSWFGKPLYQKTIVGTAGAADEYKTFSFGASVEVGWIAGGFLITASGFCKSFNSVDYRAIDAKYYASNDIHADIATANHSETPNTVRIRIQNSLWENRPIYISVRYTKTTD